MPGINIGEWGTCGRSPASAFDGSPPWKVIVMSEVSRRGRTATPVQLAGVVVAAVFLVVGVLGFVPGVTEHFSQMEVAGHDSHAELLGVFQVSVLHNVVHLAFGVVGFLMASTVLGARNFLIGGGIIYLVLWVYGLIVGPRSDANFVPMNNADDWLHLALGAAMVLLGAALATRRRSTTVG